MQRKTSFAHWRNTITSLNAHKSQARSPPKSLSSSGIWMIYIYHSSLAWYAVIALRRQWHPGKWKVWCNAKLCEVIYQHCNLWELAAGHLCLQLDRNDCVYGVDCVCVSIYRWFGSFYTRQDKLDIFAIADLISYTQYIYSTSIYSVRLAYFSFVQK